MSKKAEQINIIPQGNDGYQYVFSKNDRYLKKYFT